MTSPRHPYVLNLPDWELPHLDEMEWTLVERLAEAARRRSFRPELLKDELYHALHGSLMELVECAVNETIEYWLKGLGDGNDGRWPELCVELPYLEQGEAADPLTLTYCVENGDGTRTELNRTTLGAVVSRALDTTTSPAVRGRARIMAFALQKLAERLENPPLR